MNGEVVRGSITLGIPFSVSGGVPNDIREGGFLFYFYFFLLHGGKVHGTLKIEFHLFYYF